MDSRSNEKFPEHFTYLRIIWEKILRILNILEKSFRKFSSNKYFIKKALNHICLNITWVFHNCPPAGNK